MLDPIPLRSLHEVLATGSFAEAGMRLGFTASAVSQQISALERTTGLVLFERGPRSVRPTPAANALGARVAVLLGHLETLEQEIRVMAAGDGGVVRIGSFPSASASLLPAALARLRRSHPQLEILLEEAEPDESIPRLRAGSIDLALVYEYDTVPQFWPGDLAPAPLLRESFVLLVATSHWAAGRHSITLGELTDETWAASRADATGARSLERLAAVAGFSPRVAYRSNDYNVLRGLAGAGVAVALVPALAHVEDPVVRSIALRAEAGTAFRQVLTLRRRADVNPAVDAVLDALVRSSRARARTDRRVKRPPRGGYIMKKPTEGVQA